MKPIKYRNYKINMKLIKYRNYKINNNYNIYKL